MTSIVAHIASAGERLSAFTRRWIPDSWVVCMMLTAVAMVLAVAGAGAGVHEVVLAWGGGMWSLLELAMQFTLAMVAAHACVSSRPVFRLLDRLARLPDAGRPLQAVALVAAYSLVTAFLNWALCLVASALFVPFVCRRNPKADVRVLIAAAYIGLGTTWHGGLSGSGPLILATPGNPLINPATGAPAIDLVIPITDTLFTLFNLLYMAVISAVAMAALMAVHPRRHVVTLTAEQIDRIMPSAPADPPASPDEPGSRSPAARMDTSPVWVALAAFLILYWLGHSVLTRGFGATWTINAYNMVFLTAALLLQGRPSRLVRAVADGTRTTSGIILQFPFYAGIFGVINSTGLGAWLGQLFVAVATTETYPLVVYVYSGVMNLFVPSDGSKWMIEAPYLLPAARELGVSATTTVLAYSYGDSTTNLIQPFWAIPILAVTRLRFGDIVGYTGLVAVICFLVTAVAMLLVPAQL